MRDNMKYITRIYHVNKHTKDIFKDVSGNGNHIMLQWCFCLYIKTNAIRTNNTKHYFL